MKLKVKTAKKEVYNSILQAYCDVILISWNFLGKNCTLHELPGSELEKQIFLFVFRNTFHCPKKFCKNKTIKNYSLNILQSTKGTLCPLCLYLATQTIHVHYTCECCHKLVSFHGLQCDNGWRRQWRHQTLLRKLRPMDLYNTRLQTPTINLLILTDENDLVSSLHTLFLTGM